MAHYKMKYFGSCGGKSGKTYHFERGQIIETVSGEFSPEIAEDVSNDFVEKKEVVHETRKNPRTRK